MTNKPASPKSVRFLLFLAGEKGTPEGDASTAVVVSDADEIVNHGGAARGVRLSQAQVSRAIDAIKAQA